MGNGAAQLAPLSRLQLSWTPHGPRPLENATLKQSGWWQRISWGSPNSEVVYSLCSSPPAPWSGGVPPNGWAPAACTRTNAPWQDSLDGVKARGQREGIRHEQKIVGQAVEHRGAVDGDAAFVVRKQLEGYGCRAGRHLDEAGELQSARRGGGGPQLCEHVQLLLRATTQAGK